MALFNETLAGRFNEVIRRLHQVKQTPAPQISPEIFHGIILENDRPEYHSLHGGFLWAMRRVSGAVALNFSNVGIRNPTGSGLLVVVENISVDNAGAVTQAYNLRTRAQGTFASTATSFFRDSRRGFGGNCPVLVCDDNTTTGAFGSGPLETITVLGGQSGEPFLSTPYVLTPGFELIVAPNSVNQACDVDWAGYARPITDEELKS